MLKVTSATLLGEKRGRPTRLPYLSVLIGNLHDVLDVLAAN